MLKWSQMLQWLKGLLELRLTKRSRAAPATTVSDFTPRPTGTIFCPGNLCPYSFPGLMLSSGQEATVVCERCATQFDVVIDDNSKVVVRGR